MFPLVYVYFSVANWCCGSPTERTSPLYVALEVTGPWLIFLFRCGYFDDTLLEGMERPDRTEDVPAREQSKI